MKKYKITVWKRTEPCLHNVHAIIECRWLCIAGLIFWFYFHFRAASMIDIRCGVLHE